MLPVSRWEQHRGDHVQYVLPATSLSIVFVLGAGHGWVLVVLVAASTSRHSVPPDWGSCNMNINIQII